MADNRHRVLVLVVTNDKRVVCSSETSQLFELGLEAFGNKTPVEFSHHFVDANYLCDTTLLEDYYTIDIESKEVKARAAFEEPPFGYLLAISMTVHDFVPNFTFLVRNTPDLVPIRSTINVSGSYAFLLLTQEGTADVVFAKLPRSKLQVLESIDSQFVSKWIRAANRAIEHYFYNDKEQPNRKRVRK